ncbi:alcohol dehydrogenase [Nocardia sp. NPDC051990]|uniref:alcohol dehydrogenase n=1 Tax=Nocardia sp. NPDC051990 TaxID=3155285 RepID=UPI00342F12AF
MRAFAIAEEGSAATELVLAATRPTGREILLRVIRAGVCHTDTHLREGGYDLGSRGKMRLTDRGINYPLVLGHEVVGVVEQIGDDVHGVDIGDIRLVYPWIGCGQCHQCQAGRDNYCSNGQNLGVARPGGYADHIVVPDAKYLVDIAGIDPSWAATLACSGVTAYSAVNKVLPLPAAEPIVVIGAGGVGLTAIATLKALGHDEICAVDVSEENLRLALEIGATRTVRSTDGTAKQIIRTCGGPVAAIIDFVNNGITAAAAFEALRKGGKLVQVGLFGGELVVPTALMTLKMLELNGSFVGTLDELRAVVALAKSNALPRIPILEYDLDADSVNSALERLAHGGVPGRIVLREPGSV